MSKKKKEPKSEADEVLLAATRVENLFIFCAMMKGDLPVLKRLEGHLESDISTYRAIGFMDGPGYDYKLKDMEARQKRLKAVITLIETLFETEEDVSDSKGKAARASNVISDMMGL